MNLGERQEALLRLVEEYRAQECGRILEAARQEAAELRWQSFRKQRAHLHARILVERSRARAAIQAARAERATRERSARERRHLALLQSAWPLLREQLLARWRVSGQRRRWARTYLRRAVELLPHGCWTVRHAPEWSDEEREEVLAELTHVLGESPRFYSDRGIEAGLVVESGGAVLDASLQGLLRDRTRLQARLLALLATAAGS